MKKITAILILISMFLFINPLITYAHTTIDIDFYELFEHHGSIMLLINPETGAIEHANKAAADFYGYTVEELESMNVIDLHTLAPEEVKEEIQAALERQKNHFVFEHKLTNGDIRTVEVYSCPHTQDDKTILFATVYDITAKTQLTEKNRVMSKTIQFALSGMILIIGLFSFLLLRSKRRLEKLNISLKKSEESLRLLLDSTAEGIYGIDKNGNCTFCNASCLKLLGYEHQDQLLGKNMHWQIHYKRLDGTELPLDDCRIFRAFMNGEGTHVEDEVFWRADGTYFHAEYYSYPQYRNGEIIGAVVTFTDITERKLAQSKIIEANEQLENINKQLQEKQYSLEEQHAVIEELNAQLEEENIRYQRQKEILQAIIDSLGAGIVMVDTSGKITFINKAWKDLFNYLDLNRCHFSCENFYMDDTCGDTEEFLRNMTTDMENGQEIAANLIKLIRDGESRYAVDIEQTSPVKRFLHLYSNPCISDNGHVFGRIYCVRDISHQKEVDRLKLELINTVSHELRTPMSSILGFSELLLTRKLSEERNKEYISIINSEARRLTNLINDFLDIQRMESGKQVYNKQYNSLDQIIGEAIKLFQNVSYKHTIVYNKRIEGLLRVYCDKDKILQVISNILSNAIKYSPDGGEVIVDLTEEDGKAKVSITDHGLGIPEDVKDKLFTKFYRIDNDDRRKIGGTGLGLAICKEIIRAHGGEIGFTSVYGKGSTFYFTIPYLNESLDYKPEKIGELNSDSYNDRGKLLIVEDDYSMVRLIKETLKSKELEMHDVSSGEEALKLAGKYHYKLIILDIALSGKMNGWDVLKKLKNTQANADTPIIISSVYENKDIASHDNIYDYLVKPFEPEQLIKVVQKAINGKLNSKMMVNGDESLTDEILDMLNSRGIKVKQIEYAGNMLIITLKGVEGVEDESEF